METEAARTSPSPVVDLTPVWVKRSPPWIVSGVLHLLLILLATTMVFSETPARAFEARIKPSPRTLTEWKDPALPPSVVEAPDIPHDVIRPDPVVEIDDPEPVPPKGKPDMRANRNTNNDTGPDFVFGLGGIPSGQYGTPLGEGRARGSGSDGKRKILLDRGLDWLAAHQSPDGSWDCDGFQEHCKKNECSGTGFEGYEVGVTGLALLAYAGVGQTPWYGRHRNAIRKAVRWLASQQDKDGAIGRNDSEGWMYNHAIATMALCEIRAMAGAHAHTLRKSTDEAVAFCLRAQNPGMGWRYEPRSGDNDASVTGWMILALKAARMAEMSVPKKAFLDARAFFDRTTAKDGRVGYRAPDGESSYLTVQEGKYGYVPTLTAVAVLCRRLTGQARKHEAIRDGTEILLTSLPSPESRNVNHYYWYYATYAMFQATRGPRDPQWRKWQRALMQALLPTQRTDQNEDEYGSWDPIGEWGIAGGRVYSTAINLLTLEASFRYERMK